MRTRTRMGSVIRTRFSDQDQDWDQDQGSVIRTRFSDQGQGSVTRPGLSDKTRTRAQ